MKRNSTRPIAPALSKRHRVLRSVYGEYLQLASPAVLRSTFSVSRACCCAKINWLGEFARCCITEDTRSKDPPHPSKTSSSITVPAFVTIKGTVSVRKLFQAEIGHLRTDAFVSRASHPVQSASFTYSRKNQFYLINQRHAATEQEVKNHAVGRTHVFISVKILCFRYIHVDPQIRMVPPTGLQHVADHHANRLRERLTLAVRRCQATSNTVKTYTNSR